MITLLNANSSPYERLGITAHPTDWLEAVYRYTNLEDVLFGGQLGLLDKSFDAKLRLLNESINFPAIAVGIRDMGGTGLFNSEYFVATKTFNNFNASIGIGWGYMGSYNSFKNPFSILGDRFHSEQRDTVDFGGTGGKLGASYWFTGQSALFGGVEFYLPFSKGLKFKIEYDSDEYKGSGNSSKVKDSAINYGLVWPVNKYFHISSSYLRGNTFSFGWNITLDFSKPIAKKTKRQQIVKVSGKEKDSDLDFYRSLLKNLNNNQYYLQSANINEEEVKVVIAQNQFFNNIKSSKEVMNIVDKVAPENINYIKVQNTNAGFATNTVGFNRGHLTKINNGDKNVVYLNNLSIQDGPVDFQKGNSFNPKIIWPIFNWDFGFGMRTHIGQPTNFFNYAFDFKANFILQLNRQISMQGAWRKGLNNTFDRIILNPDSNLEHVRSDIGYYLSETASKGSIGKLQLNYIDKILPDTYIRASVGLFEQMFGGVGGELLWRPFNQSFGIGYSYYELKQRDYAGGLNFFDGKSFGGRKSYSVDSGHTTLYHYFTPLRMTSKISYGKYLARDEGFTFDFSRSTQSGTTFGVYWTLTNIDADLFGEGSFDKGFYFQVPLHLLSSKQDTNIFNFGLSPLTRDGGARLVDEFDLWGLTYQGSKYFLEQDKYDFLED